MRLPEEKIKQAILHPEADIRQRAVAYFAKSFSPDVSVMPLVIRTVELYGKEDAYHLIGRSITLAQSGDTISWIIDELSDERSANYENYTYNLNRVLWHTDPALLIGKESQIVEARHFDPDLGGPLLERLGTVSWDEIACWRKLEEICEGAKDEDNELPSGYASSIIEALARMGNRHEERIRSVLSQGISSLRNDPMEWMQPLMVELAGWLRLECMIPLLVEKLLEDDDFLAEECRDALTRIGTNSVVEAIARQFADAPRSFRLYATGPLENIHSDLAVATCLRFLPHENDRGIKRDLAHAALSQLSSEAIEPVRQMLLVKKLSGEEKHLRDYLVETCEIIEERFPEYDQWLADGVRERQEHQRKLHALRDDPKALLSWAFQRMGEYKEVGDSQGQESTAQQQPARFVVGDHVRVKHGVVDVGYPDMPMGGWAGTIIGVSGADTFTIRWSEETLAAIHPVFKKRCEKEGLELEEYALTGDDLEPDTGGPLCMEQPTNINTRPLSMDDQDDRICMVFGLTSDDPLPTESNGTELTYFAHLKANLTFPFPARFTDHANGRKREVTVKGMCDDFPIDEGFGVVCEVLDGGEKGEMPLSELELEPGSPNYQTVDDYITWFVNAPEAGADDDLDGDWDEECEDDDYGEEEDDLDDEVEDEPEEEPPPPTRQKVGRNDPCPCGSGKKFKKCCLRKQNGSSLID